MAGKRYAAIVAGMDKEYQREYITGLAQAVQQAGDDLFVFSCQGFPEMERVINEKAESRIFNLLDFEDYDGIASLVRTIPDEEMALEVQKRLDQLYHVPIVTLDVKESSSTRINFNDEKSLTEMIEHMIHVHHHRTFALITGPCENVVARLRTRVAKQVIEKNGCSIVLEYDARWTRAGGRAGARKVLELPELPDAILCCNDDAAMALIDHLNERNIHVPQDVAVTGVDARPDAVSMGVTTIRRTVRHAGALSAEVMLNGDIGKKKIILDNEVVIGTTCGCPRNMHRFVPIHVYAETDRAEQKLFHGVSISSRMTEAETLKDAADIVIDFARSCNVRHFYIAVDPTFFRDAGKLESVSELPQEMLLLAGVNGQQEYRLEKFDRKDLIPGLKEEHESKVLTFLPLYYGDRTIGYMAADLNFTTGPAILPVCTLIDGALMELAQRVAIKGYVEALEKLTHHDPLTGLYNRRGFYQRAEDLFNKAMNEGRELAILSIDMDSMKLINDRYGHLYGDEAIRRMGRCVLKLNKYNVLCSHMSGDEFMAAMVVDEEGMIDLPRILEEEINRLNRDEPWIANIHASVGMFVSVPTDKDTLADFIRFADNRMYENKRTYKTTLRTPLRN